MATIQKRSRSAGQRDRLVNLLSWRWAILKATAEEMPPTRAHVLLVLSCHMSDAGDGCWPSQGTLVAETKLSRRSVQEHLKAAVDAGWLVRTAVTRDGAVTGTVYHTAIPAAVVQRMQEDLSAGEDVQDPEPEQGGGAGDAPPPSQASAAGGRAQEVRQGGAARAPGWRSTCAGVAQEVRPNSTGNSTLNSTGNERAPAAPAGSLSVVQTSGQNPERRASDVPRSAVQTSGRVPGVAVSRGFAATNEDLDRLRSDVIRALFPEAPVRDWNRIFRGQFTEWERLWRLCAGDVEEAVRVALAGQARCTSAGQAITLQALLRRYEEWCSAAYQPSPPQAGGKRDVAAGNAALLEQLAAGGES